MTQPEPRTAAGRAHRFSTDAAYRLMEECACECERCFAESRCDVHWTRHLPNPDTILAIEAEASRIDVERMAACLQEHVNLGGTITAMTVRSCMKAEPRT
jgi:hypothetical protein